MAKIDGKVVIVTGASSGIGLATSKRLLADGATVVGADLSPAPASLGDRWSFVPTDVTDEAAVAALVAAAVSSAGRLDGLVNAAGVIGNGPLWETAPTEWDRVMDSNARSLYLMTRAAAEALKARKGSVVNLGSVAGNRPYAGLMAYCVSKAAV